MSTKQQIKAKETYYNGYRFRSRAEARWAVFFDNAGIKYFYEPEGFLVQGTDGYLPDFYLPESKAFFEVKGVLDDDDLSKIENFMKENNIPVAIGYSDMTFQSPNWDWDYKFYIVSKENSSLSWCPNCGCLLFMSFEGLWACTGCHHNDGNGENGLWNTADGDAPFLKTYGKKFDYIQSAFLKARQARFEHGEKG